MSWYYTAGFAFQHPHPRRTVFFYLMTITLCITALADRTELYQQVLLASTAPWFLGRSILLVDTPSTAANGPADQKQLKKPPCRT